MRSCDLCEIVIEKFQSAKKQDDELKHFKRPVTKFYKKQNEMVCARAYVRADRCVRASASAGERGAWRCGDPGTQVNRYILTFLPFVPPLSLSPFLSSSPPSG